jgi:hypothetical protein
MISAAKKRITRAMAAKQSINRFRRSRVMVPTLSRLVKESSSHGCKAV